jgi:hypothetical protein
MSNIVLQPNSSGTGSITIATPNTNTDRTLNIPDVAGNLVTTGDSATVTDAMMHASLDLSAKTLTMPTGHIIQKVVKVSATAVTVTNAVTATAFGLNQTFTPKFANSTILIVANIAAEHYGTHTDRGLRFEFRKDSSQIRYWPYMDYHSNDNSQNISTQTLIHSESAGSTSARTYEVRFCASTGTNTSSRTNNYNGPSNMVITEIAG